jgi:hypothetical protein
MLFSCVTPSPFRVHLTSDLRLFHLPQPSKPADLPNALSCHVVLRSQSESLYISPLSLSSVSCGPLSRLGPSKAFQAPSSYLYASFYVLYVYVLSFLAIECEYVLDSEQ